MTSCVSGDAGPRPSARAKRRERRGADARRRAVVAEQEPASADHDIAPAHPRDRRRAGAGDDQCASPPPWAPRHAVTASLAARTLAIPSKRASTRLASSALESPARPRPRASARDPPRRARRRKPLRSARARWRSPLRNRRTSCRPAPRPRRQARPPRREGAPGNAKRRRQRRETNADRLSSDSPSAFFETAGPFSAERRETLDPSPEQAIPFAQAPQMRVHVAEGHVDHRHAFERWPSLYS